MQLVAIEHRISAALRVLIDLGRSGPVAGGAPLAARTGLSVADGYLALAALARAGLINTAADGAWRLAHAPAAIDLAEVFFALDPDGPPVACQLGRRDCTTGLRCTACRALLEIELQATEVSLATIL